MLSCNSVVSASRRMIARLGISSGTFLLQYLDAKWILLPIPATPTEILKLCMNGDALNHVHKFELYLRSTQIIAQLHIIAILTRLTFVISHTWSSSYFFIKLCDFAFV